MKYRDGYDGQVVETETFQLPSELHPKEDIFSEFLDLNTYGYLTIKMGYAWDYASVPFTHWISNKIQGKRSKTPSLVHDALCQLHRNKLLVVDDLRLHADKLFYDMLLERKFWKIRAWLWYRAVRVGAKANEQKPKEVFEAP